MLATLIKNTEDDLLSAASDKQLSDETVEGPVKKDQCCLHRPLSRNKFHTY